MNILVAGIGGASLGTEIIKSLQHAGKYTVYGCDISEYAYGHFQGIQTFNVSKERYIEDVKAICKRYDIDAIIPGAEGSLKLLIEATINAHIASNSLEVVDICSNKDMLFRRLKRLKLPTPFTTVITNPIQVLDVPYPCVIKPATGTGGSHLVFLASATEEAVLYTSYVLKHTEIVMLQEYIPLDEGEFTVGVLTLGNKTHSIAMQRLFHSKLSIRSETEHGLISSGYSQGVIDDFPEIRKQAEVYAQALGSTGPMNIQGRVKDGVLYPFEINPRFSASTYLRTLAGFNEIDMYLQFVLNEVSPPETPIKRGLYLRSFTEVVTEK